MSILDFILNNLFKFEMIKSKSSTILSYIEFVRILFGIVYILIIEFVTAVSLNYLIAKSRFII